ncbi:MAG TPA: SDR family oxidoreductase [Azospirillum sp.]|nr:SDR family oxidoreductase [Azospirillum sp.]
MPKLNGKVALVTGASRGIGLSAVQALTQAGATVVGLARSVQPSDRSLPCDVSDWNAVADAVRTVTERFGGIDIVVNNAGVVEPIGRLGDTDPALWHRNVAINLGGPYNLVRAALPSLLARRGTVINVSSGAAHRPIEGWSAYCAGKAGLAMLTGMLALEYGSEGLRVFGFQPGVVDTEMQAEIRASGINEVSRLRREGLAKPQDPARAIVYLCTPDADDLAGKELTIRDPALRQRMGLA